MDGAVEVLETLQRLGIALGLVTNGTVRVQAQKLDILGLRSYFRTVVVSEAVGVEKPHAAIFQHALDGLGLRADHAWFVGDHPENDILGAWRVACAPCGCAAPPLAGDPSGAASPDRPLTGAVPLLMSARLEAP